ncbi:YjjW family glycine radical enzyme activase [Clostridium sp.]|uniref:YjjW family glycine radical enzyme activase n=1 Tax=Clostridium sp. TaxID=1506 RepID=UPI00263667DA|nr:YjjW family glycine radical enzyme activase [Clostridium sp.]
MITAPINRIIPYSVVDGPGNRTSIFLQGCNIRCAYCHNPETQNTCCNCGICIDVCKSSALSLVDGKVIWDEEKCTMCDSCINICPHNASPKIKMMTSEELFMEVKKNIPFIRGITVSGGECTLHPEFLLELFTLAKAEKLTCLIDSNGMVDFTLYPELLKKCDGVMLDVKAWNLSIYKKLTGFGNDIVKKNLKLLSDKNKIEELRIVCMPNEVDAEDVIQGITQIIGEKVADTKLKLIKFRHYGVKGKLENIKSPDDEYMDNLHQKAIKAGFKKIILT